MTSNNDNTTSDAYHTALSMLLSFSGISRLQIRGVFLGRPLRRIWDGALALNNR